MPGDLYRTRNTTRGRVGSMEMARPRADATRASRLHQITHTRVCCEVRGLTATVLRQANLRLIQPPLQPMKRERHFGNIRVTEGIGRIACGWLNRCVLCRLTNNYDQTNQPINSHYE